MITFLICLSVLIGGYFLYGRYLDKVMGIDSKATTPAFALRDDVDYLPMSTPKVFLIQFLNIAGLGPIYGAIMGAMYGPVVFLWITLGTILAGGVHDYISGVVSLRSNGKSLPEIIGDHLGITVRQVVRIFTICLMILVGAVFVSGPADILNSMVGGAIPIWIWITLIFAYYVIATLFPIDKIIGRIYPFFGAALFIMAIGILGAMFFYGAEIPNLTSDTFTNLHPQADQLPIFPFLFVSVACGAISGFHATQSPLMARCIKTEADSRKVFYGAMVAEGVIAMIWAGAAMSFFGGITEFQGFMASNGDKAALVVSNISDGWLGHFGRILVLLGVVAAPITTGDTAFRSARLIVADIFGISQSKLVKRVLIALPLFAVAFILLQVNFDIVWRYFAWSNQTLAVFTLWAMTVYLSKKGKCYWITLIPALLMTAVSVAYILIAQEGFRLETSTGYAIAIAVDLLALIYFFWKKGTLSQKQV